MAGFSSGIIQVFLIPLDIENTRSNFGLDMHGAWTAFLVINSILLILVIPYLLFYYETDCDAAFVRHSHAAHATR